MTDPKQEKRILTGLKKARSHLENVIAMVENKHYCIDILQQNLAVIGLLKSANQEIFSRHLNSCFIQAMKGAGQKRQQLMLEEILKINKLTQ